MRILHIVGALPLGGSERMLCSIASSVKGQHTLACLSPRTHPFITDALGAAGAHIHHFPELAEISPYLSRLRIFSKSLRHFLEHNTFDVAMSWMSKPSIVSASAIYKYNKKSEKPLPLIWNVQDTDPSAYLSGEEITALNKFSASPALAMVSCSGKAAQEVYGKIFSAECQTRVISNGANADLFVPSSQAREVFRRQHNIAPDAPVVIFPARYTDAKDVPTFLAAARQVVAKHPQVMFVVCGKGMDVQNKPLQQLTKGIEKNVLLLGTVNDLHLIFPAADVICMTSKAESSSLSVLEGMACGNTPVVTRCGELPHLVGSTGFICEIGNPASVAAGLHTAIENIRNAPLNERARERVIEHFSVARAAKEYTAAFEEVLLPNHRFYERIAVQKNQLQR